MKRLVLSLLFALTQHHPVTGNTELQAVIDRYEPQSNIVDAAVNNLQAIMDNPARQKDFHDAFTRYGKEAGNLTITCFELQIAHSYPGASQSQINEADRLVRREEAQMQKWLAIIQRADD